MVLKKNIEKYQHMSTLQAIDCCLVQPCAAHENFSMQFATLCTCDVSPPTDDILDQTTPLDKHTGFWLIPILVHPSH